MSHEFKCINEGNFDKPCPICEYIEEHQKLTAEARMVKYGIGPAARMMKAAVKDGYATMGEISNHFLKAAKIYNSPIITAQQHITPQGVLTVPSPGVLQKSYGGSRSNSQALALALQNNWDVVVPKDDELFIDIDSDEQLAQHYRAMSSFDQYVCKITDHIEQSSKSGKKGRYHIYIRVAQKKLDEVTRVAWQSLLCSDSVREILSIDRIKSNDPYPTLFFELPGKTPAGFGQVIQPAQKAVVSSAPPPAAAPTGYFTAKPAAVQPTASKLPTASAPPDPSRYPHQCPKCGGPSYNGLFNFDCMKGCKP